MSRVVLLPSAYLPTLGGVQELTRNLALALADAGDQVEVWSTQDPAVADPTTHELDGLMVRKFSFWLPNSRIRSLLPAAIGGIKTLGALRRAVREFKPDILHVQCFGPNGAYATALSLITGVPLVVTLQGETFMDDHDIFDRSVVIRTAIRVGLKRAAAVTGCSAFTLRDAEGRFGLQPGRGRVVFNGVDLRGSVESTCTGSFLGDHLLALGRVVPKKGFDLLLRAFAPVADKHPEISLAIGGEGADLEPLRELAQQLGLADKVRFVGRLSRSEVAAVMASAMFFVMPSRVEPFGIVLLEAWRAGCPVVATSRGGAPEFVESGITGLLVDPFDTPELSRSLDRMISDSALRESVATAALVRLQEFSWTTIAKQYRDIYRVIAKNVSRT